METNKEVKTGNINLNLTNEHKLRALVVKTTTRHLMNTNPKSAKQHKKKTPGTKTRDHDSRSKTLYCNYSYF